MWAYYFYYHAAVGIVRPSVLVFTIGVKEQAPDQFQVGQITVLTRGVNPKSENKFSVADQSRQQKDIAVP